jgi:hypothetical protein
LSVKPGYRFSGHEGFPLRSVWLPKGVRAAKPDPGIFRREDALVELGVGKNMVQAIRHWCGAAGMLDAQSGVVTELGEKLLSDGGYDPYLEDPGSLWLIHWQFVRPPWPASAWHIAFSRWNIARFRRSDLVDRITELLSSEEHGTRTTEASLQRDVDVFFRTYVRARGSKDSAPEESLDSPLTALGLIEEIDRDLYVFRRGSQPASPREIFT